jgi:hypothetical protein
VQSDFPITVSEREVTRPTGRARGGRGAGRGPAAGRVNARILRGLAGNGGPLVTLRSFSGAITIARR